MRALLVGMLVVCNACKSAALAPTPRRAELPSRLTARTHPSVVPALERAARDPSSLARVRVRELGWSGLEVATYDTGPTRTLDSCHDFEVPALAFRNGEVRVAVQEDNAILALWIPESTLGSVVHTPAPVRDSGITLQPGAPITVLETRGDLSRVEMNHLAERLTGWIPSSTLGIAYYPLERGPRTATKTWIANGQPLFSQPSSTAAAPTFVQLFGGPYEKLGESNGFTELAYSSPFVEAHGFVPTSTVGKARPTGMCESGDNTLFFGDVLHPMWRQRYYGPLEVPAGTCLRDQRGAIIGIQLATARKDVMIADWAETIVTTRWGGQAVRVPVVQRPDGSYAVDARSCTP